MSFTDQLNRSTVEELRTRLQDALLSCDYLLVKALLLLGVRLPDMGEVLFEQKTFKDFEEICRCFGEVNYEDIFTQRASEHLLLFLKLDAALDGQSYVEATQVSQEIKNLGSIYEDEMKSRLRRSTFKAAKTREYLNFLHSFGVREFDFLFPLDIVPIAILAEQ